MGDGGRVTGRSREQQRIDALARQLAEAEDRCRALFAAIPSGLIHFAADGSVIEANPAARDILGLDRADLPACPVLVPGLPECGGGSGKEQARHGGLDRPLGEQPERHHPYGGGEDDVDHEGGRGAEPDRAGPGFGGQRQRGDHCLVGQLAEEDDWEDRGGNGEVQAGGAG